MVNGLMPADFTDHEDNTAYDLSGQTGPLMEILRVLRANNVPIDRMADARLKPFVRDEIQVIVRTAAAAQAAQASAVKPAVQLSIADRLQQLERLHTSGALGDREYSTKRAQIIAEL